MDNDERRKALEDEHAMRMQIIKTGYEIMTAKLHPKLPVDARRLELLKAARKSLERA